ncbi:MAG: hypothetical protein ACE5EX_01875 [Phycisphaerae bacterium]
MVSACACVTSSGCTTDFAGSALRGTDAAASCVEPCILQEILDVTDQPDAQGAESLAAGVRPGGCLSEQELGALLDAAITQPGDLWVMGQHRLLCGDSAGATDVDRLLDGQPIHLVNTDPLYHVKVEPRSNNAIAAGLSSFTAHEARRQTDARPRL